MFLKVSRISQKETPTQVFSCEICKIFKNIYLEEHLPTTVSDPEYNLTRYLLYSLAPLDAKSNTSVIRLQLAKSLVIAIRGHVVKTYNNYASALIIDNVLFTDLEIFHFYLLFIFHKKITA